MGNMSYCRFQNTYQDLKDCHNALSEMPEGGENPLSRDELGAAKRLAQTCADILELLSNTLDVGIEDLWDNSDNLEQAVEKLQDQAKRAQGEEEDE